MRPLAQHPGIFAYRSRGKTRYCVRVSVHGEDHKRQGFPSLELARTYRDKVRLRSVLSRHLPEQMEVPFAEAVTLYWSAFKAKGRIDAVRPKGIIEQYLIPAFGRYRLHQLTARDGLAYVRERQRQQASPGTIQREWQVLMRILNLAVKYDLVPKNRLAAVEVPKGSRRDRVATPDELTALYAVADPELWRIVTVAVQTGLRQGALLALEGRQVQPRKDGPWLTFGTAASPLKRLPKELPLTTTAWTAIIGAAKTLPPGRLFLRWQTERALHHYWADTLTLTRIQDLTFHDLRHTFATRLQDLGVGYEVRQALLGHTMPGMTARYSHGGPGWQRQLRQAVTNLETAFPVPSWAQAGSKRPTATRDEGGRFRPFSALISA
jgi:integrase